MKLLVLLSAWVYWTFTVLPGGQAFRYEAEADTGLGWLPKTLYANTVLDPKIPRYTLSDTAFTDTVWTVCTTGGSATNLRFRTLNELLQPGPWSNAGTVVPLGTYPVDTTLYGWRDNLWLVCRGGGSRNATFKAPPDSLQRPLIVWTLDREQEQNALPHCNAAGYGWFHGVRKDCWP